MKLTVFTDTTTKGQCRWCQGEDCCNNLRSPWRQIPKAWTQGLELLALPSQYERRGGPQYASQREEAPGEGFWAQLQQESWWRAITDEEQNSSTAQSSSSQHKKGHRGGGEKVQIQIDGKMHEVIERGIFLWCMLCKTKCNSKNVMTDHIRGKKHLSEVSKRKLEKTKDAAEQGMLRAGSVTLQNWSAATFASC